MSQDLDLVIDARFRPHVIPVFIGTLTDLGFTSAGVSPDDVAHRFVHGEVKVDVVSPDGVGERTDLRTVGSATTIEVSRGTQALHRSERVPVSHHDRTVLVPRPNLNPTGFGGGSISRVKDGVMTQDKSQLGWREASYEASRFDA